MECKLCGLPAKDEFCCIGCSNVHAILVESGVTDFRNSDLYQQSLKLGLISNGQPQAAPVPEAETREMLYHLSGLWCTSCGWLIEHALTREHGVVSAEVIFTSDLLRVRYCPQYLEPGRIPKRVESLGYGISEYKTERTSEWRDLLLRTGVAGALWMNVMLFSLVVYASYFEGIADWAHRFVPFILMALATPVVFYSAWPILRLAWAGVRAGAIRMELLISTGILAAYGYSAVQAFQGGQHFYFDTACAIVTLVLAGKAMERGAKERTAKSIALLYRLMPKKARILQDGRERFVAVEALEPGMTLLVRPGERIPADARVTEGSSPVDESVVTGESEPRIRAAGDDLIGGSLNGAGVLVASVTRAGDDSTLAHIVHSVESAIASRTPLERTVDRVSRIFVPVVLFIAVATAIFGGEGALLRGVAVLVIACPCALGIATPLATTAAIGAASRRGILIRDAQVLETFRSVDLVILDKTGTATEGQFRVRETTLSKEDLGLLAALESRSEHPLARAVLDFAGPSVVPTNVEIHPGLGISGLVNGRRVRAGSRSFLGTEANVPPPSDLTSVHVVIDEIFRGTISFGDKLRPDAIQLVSQLRAAGITTVLLSGDDPDTTARIAERLGTDEYRGGVTPMGKAEAVASYRNSGRVVAMVGDGINDAPALAAADLGIAMGSGTDLAMQAAPVVLMSDSLERIREAFDVARMTARVVRQNLFWAFFYNTIGIALAITGILNPILAAAAMVFSSLSVIGNSVRLQGVIAPRSAACTPVGTHTARSSDANCSPAAPTPSPGRSLARGRT